MDRYSARINLHGETSREREVNRLKADILNKVTSNPSYKDVLLNGEPTKLIINSGTKPYYKEFETLPDTKISEGDYIEWSNHTWLVYEADVDDEIYVDGALRQCQYVLYWQNENGDIISRAAWVQNASAYNNGEEGNNTITLQSNQFMVYMPFDEDTEILNNGMRMNMCKSAKLCRPYTLTRPDDITYTYGDKGVLNIIFTQCQFDADKDKQVTLPSGDIVWICDYKESTSSPIVPEPDETVDLYTSIIGDTTLKYGRAKSWTVQFVDKDGNEVLDRDFTWNVVSDFEISQTITGNKISLIVYDDSFVDESFLLQVVMDDSVIAEIEIVIETGL